MRQLIAILCIAFCFVSLADAQRGSHDNAAITDERKITYTDPTGRLAPDDFYIQSDALRQVEQIVLSPSQVSALPFPSTRTVKTPSGFTQEQTDLLAKVELDGRVYDMESFRHARTGISFTQFRPTTKELRPLNAAFHQAFRADSTISVTVISKSTGKSVLLFEGTLEGKASGGRGS